MVKSTLPVRRQISRQNVDGDIGSKSADTCRRRIEQGRQAAVATTFIGFRYSRDSIDDTSIRLT